MTHHAPDLSKLSDTDIVEHLLAAEADETAAKSAVKKLKNELIVRKQAEINAAYKDKPEPFGVVNIGVAGMVMKVDTKKSVEWDQEKLQQLWTQIQADGANPREFIKVEYGVNETLYKLWGDNLKSYFNEARTVKAANPSIKIEETKE